MKSELLSKSNIIGVWQKIDCNTNSLNKRCTNYRNQTRNPSVHFGQITWPLPSSKICYCMNFLLGLVRAHNFRIVHTLNSIECVSNYSSWISFERMLGRTCSTRLDLFFCLENLIQLCSIVWINWHFDRKVVLKEKWVHVHLYKYTNILHTQLLRSKTFIEGFLSISIIWWT